MRKYLLLAIFFFAPAIAALDFLDGEDESCFSQLAASFWEGVNYVKDNLFGLFRYDTIPLQIIRREFENEHASIDLALALVLFAENRGKKFSPVMLKHFNRYDSLRLGRRNQAGIKNALRELQDISHLSLLYENLRRLTPYQRKAVHQLMRQRQNIVCETYRHDHLSEKKNLDELNVCLRSILVIIADNL